jgi:hypothetical protein
MEGTNWIGALNHLFAEFGNKPESETFEHNLWKICRMRSMSVGDFVCLDEQWYQCANVGWNTVTEERVDEVMEMPVYDTWLDRTLR